MASRARRLAVLTAALTLAVAAPAVAGQPTQTTPGFPTEPQPQEQPRKWKRCAAIQHIRAISRTADNGGRVPCELVYAVAQTWWYLDPLDEPLDFDLRGRLWVCFGGRTVDYVRGSDALGRRVECHTGFDTAKTGRRYIAVRFTARATDLD